MNVERLLSRIALLGIAAGAAFGVCELLARVYLTRFADAETFQHFASIPQLEARHKDRARYSLHRYLGYYPTPEFTLEGEQDHDSLGFRGREVAVPKPPGEFRIVCLGGSTTYTLSPTHSDSYPDLLEDELRRMGHAVRVVNAGAHGYSSFESLINLEFRVLDLDPDLIIVYHAVNDVSTRLVFPLYTYRGDNSGMRGPRVSRDRSIFEYSTFMRMILISAGWMEPPNRVEFRRMSIGGTPEHTHVERSFIQQKRAGVYPKDGFTKLSVGEILKRNGPRYFERNVRSIIAVAQTHGIVPVVATFAYMRGFAENVKSSSVEFARALDEHNEILRALVPSMGAHLFDFARLFPRERRLYLDGEHLNRRGALLKARLFARYLSSEGLLPERSETAKKPAGGRKDR